MRFKRTLNDVEGENGEESFTGTAHQIQTLESRIASMEASQTRVLQLLTELEG